jgi:hypothetical protein
VIPRATSALALLPIAVACGDRTGLLVPTPQPVSFHACADHARPWLIFDLVEATAKGFPGGIYAMRVDGTAGHFLELPHGPGHFPSISPDGSKLLYATYLPRDGAVASQGPDSALYMYDLASHTASLVVTTTTLTYSALSSDGQTVAYVSGFSLRAIDADGTNDRLLIAGPNGDGFGYGHPEFTADPRTVLYVTDGAIGTIGVDGTGNQILLTTIPGSFQYPNAAFSPDWSQLVVGTACSPSSPDALRVFPVAQLPGPSCDAGRVLAEADPGSTSNLGNDPSWGPTDLIAYDSGPDVFLVPAAGGTPSNVSAALTGDGGTISASDPVWAPGCATLP